MLGVFEVNIEGVLGEDLVDEVEELEFDESGEKILVMFVSELVEVGEMDFFKFIVLKSGEMMVIMVVSNLD